MTTLPGHQNPTSRTTAARTRAGVPQPPAESGQPLTYRARKAVHRVAARPELHAEVRSSLTELYSDLSSADPGRMARWMDVDLHSAFDSEDLVAAPQHRLQRWHNLLGHVNTVLLILPLLVTWIGLRSASAGYAGQVQDDPEAAAQPFFALWQTGFGGTSESFGAVVAWMLACLVLLAGGQLAARVLGQRIAAGAAAAEQDARRELSGALRLASCALSEARQGLPARMESQLLDSADALKLATEETRKVLVSLQRASTKAQKLIDTQLGILASAPDTMDGAAAALTTAATSLDGTSRAMGTAIGDVATQLAAVEAGRKDLGVTLTAALTGHDDAASARLAVASAEARAAHDELVAAFGLVLRQVTDSLAKDADQSAARFATAHTDLATTIDQLTEALSDAHRVHEVGAAATQTQISVLEDLIDRAQMMSDQLAGDPLADPHVEAA